MVDLGIEYTEQFSLDDAIFSLVAPVAERKDLPTNLCPDCEVLLTKKNKKPW